MYFKNIFKIAVQQNLLHIYGIHYLRLHNNIYDTLSASVKECLFLNNLIVFVYLSLFLFQNGHLSALLTSRGKKNTPFLKEWGKSYDGRQNCSGPKFPEIFAVLEVSYFGWAADLNALLLTPSLPPFLLFFLTSQF